MPERIQIDFPEYLDEAVEIWDEISDWWDNRIGDGNEAQDFLIEPTQEKLLISNPTTKCSTSRAVPDVSPDGWPTKVCKSSL